MASEGEERLFNELKVIGCCKRCILRYLNFPNIVKTFENPNVSFVNFGLISPMDEFEYEPSNKMKKRNPCIVCLDLLQNSILEQMLCHDTLKKSAVYQHEHFVPHITFPICILIRNHSMKLYLKRKFENFDENSVTQIRQAWRYSIQGKLEKILGKTYLPNAKFILHFYTTYDLDDDEIACFEKTFSHSQLSRHSISVLLESISDDDFTKTVVIPPKTPFRSVVFEDLKIYSEAVYLTGNYCKYTRQLNQKSQTDEMSIEMIMKQAINKTLGFSCEDISFRPSGREDFDVRVLGKGRTFCLQINNTKFESFSSHLLRKIEENIRNQGVIEVKDLRQDKKKDIQSALESECLSPVSVKVLCLVTEFKNIDYCVNAINMYSTITVQQNTPIKLLHKIPNKTKTKKIYHIKANKVKENLIELDMCVQSGFFVPEFIDGEFGRTNPSLCEIIRAKSFFLTMDIVDFQTTLPCAAEEDDVLI